MTCLHRYRPAVERRQRMAVAASWALAIMLFLASILALALTGCDAAVDNSAELQIGTVGAAINPTVDFRVTVPAGSPLALKLELRGDPPPTWAPSATWTIVIDGAAVRAALLPDVFDVADAPVDRTFDVNVNVFAPVPGACFGGTGTVVAVAVCEPACGLALVGPSGGFPSSVTSSGCGP